MIVFAVWRPETGRRAVFNFQLMVIERERERRILNIYSCLGIFCSFRSMNKYSSFKLTPSRMKKWLEWMRRRRSVSTKLMNHARHGTHELSHSNGCPLKLKCEHGDVLFLRATRGSADNDGVGGYVVKILFFLAAPSLNYRA